MSELEASIRNLISRYLAGRIDTNRLNDLFPDGWELDEANDSEAMNLAMLALGYLAGYQAGDRTEDELRTLLDDLVSTVQLEYPADELLTVLAWRAAETIEVSFEGDSSLEEGFEREAFQHPRTEHQTTTALLDPPRSR